MMVSKCLRPTKHIFSTTNKQHKKKENKNMAKNNLIDIELIKQYVDITEEELMMRLVKDAVGLQ